MVTDPGPILYGFRRRPVSYGFFAGRLRQELVDEEPEEIGPKLYLYR